MRTIGLGCKTLTVLIACGMGGHVSANIVASERAVLQKIYAATNGSQWTNTTANNHPWFAADANECNWYGVDCVGEHVLQLRLGDDNLVGQLPSDLDLSQLSELQTLYLYRNQLSGPIPSLAGINTLQYVDVSFNRFTRLPVLTGLSSLQIFYANTNSISGEIPSLAGLSSLSEFVVFRNRLSGAIPPLAELANLTIFEVSSNRIEGQIPSVGGLAHLVNFGADENFLSGVLPALDSLTSLRLFSVSHNQISGVIPELETLSNLEQFIVDHNALTGALPKSAPNMRFVSLCPNPFWLSPGPNDSAWNTLLGVTPWWSELNSRCDILFFGDFEAIGEE